MNKLYAFCSGLCLLGLSQTGQAQSLSQLTLRLGFNAQLNRYEVFAKPNFTKDRFAWGPSQISVVFPEEVANQTISPHSSQAGLWLDQSTVYGPAVAPNRDFHGFATQGAKTDLKANQEVMLFEFSLPKGFVEGVRLFDPTKDPNSAGSGMKGGDFVSFVSSTHGETGLKVESRAAVLQVEKNGASATLDDDGSSIGVVAYPNPVSNGFVRLHLKGFGPQEVVRVQFANLTGKQLKHFDESVETLAGRAIQLPGSGDPYLLLTVQRFETKEQFTRKIWLHQ